MRPGASRRAAQIQRGVRRGARCGSHHEGSGEASSHGSGHEGSSAARPRGAARILRRRRQTLAKRLRCSELRWRRPCCAIVEALAKRIWCPPPPSRHYDSDSVVRAAPRLPHLAKMAPGRKSTTQPSTRREPAGDDFPISWRYRFLRIYVDLGVGSYSRINSLDFLFGLCPMLVINFNLRFLLVIST